MGARPPKSGPLEPNGSVVRTNVTVLGFDLDSIIWRQDTEKHATVILNGPAASLFSLILPFENSPSPQSYKPLSFQSIAADSAMQEILGEICDTPVAYDFAVSLSTWVGPVTQEKHGHKVEIKLELENEWDIGHWLFGISLAA